MSDEGKLGVSVWSNGIDDVEIGDSVKRTEVVFDISSQRMSLRFTYDDAKSFIAKLKEKTVEQELTKGAEIIMRQCSPSVREKFLQGIYILYSTNIPEMPYFIKTRDDTKFYNVDINGTVCRTSKPDDMSGFVHIGENKWKELVG